MMIFFVNNDPVKAAQDLGDKHVVKMIVESAQLLSTVHRIKDGFQKDILSDSGRKKRIWKLEDGRDSLFYAATHVGNRYVHWTGQSVSNYLWLVEHLFGLQQEYTSRYGKKHKTERTANFNFLIQSPPLNLKEWDWTDPPRIAKFHCQCDDFVDHYRHYYNTQKGHLHNWKNRERPSWVQ